MNDALTDSLEVLSNILSIVHDTALSDSMKRPCSSYVNMSVFTFYASLLSSLSSPHTKYAPECLYQLFTLQL